jgi:hypothetical protein
MLGGLPEWSWSVGWSRSPCLNEGGASCPSWSGGAGQTRLIIEPTVAGNNWTSPGSVETGGGVVPPMRYPGQWVAVLRPVFRDVTGDSPSRIPNSTVRLARYRNRRSNGCHRI